MACFLLLLAALPARAQTPPPASYVRSFTNDVLNQPLVTVTVTGAVGVSCFTIEESLPSSATAVSIGNGGVYLPTQNAIRWGPYFNTVATNVSYRLTAVAGTYPVNGGAWMDGQWLFSPGTTMVTVQPASDPSGGGPPSPPPQVAAPAFSPPGGSVPTTVTISDTTPGAAIYYTLDGSLPTQSSTPYTTPVPLASAGTIRAAAFVTGWTPSVAVSAFYGPPAAPANAQLTRTVTANGTAAPIVTFNVAAGNVSNCLAVIESLPAGLGATNISSGGNYIASNNVVVWGPFFGTNAQTLSYQAVGLPGIYPVLASWSVDGVGATETNGTNLVIAPRAVNSTTPTPPPQVSAPFFLPPGGSVPTSVTITDTTPSAVIYYTLDGSLPTQSSTLYTTPVPLASAGTIRAAAFLTGWSPSVGVSAFYGPSTAPANAQLTRTVIANGTAAPIVTFNVAAGNVSNCLAVIESLPPGLGATNISSGGNFIASNNVVLWGPFFGTNAQTLSYQPVGLPGIYPVLASWSVDGIGATETNGTNIIITSNAVNVTAPSPPPQVATPVLLPAMASNLPVSVTITDATPGAAIYYTLNGSTPTPSSTLYTGPVLVASPTTLQAAAFLTGATPSVAIVGVYIPAPTTNTVSVARSVSGNGTIGPIVNLTATPQGPVGCYTVVETIPLGLTPSNLSGDGSWDPIAGAIRWGPYLDNQPRAFTYNVTGVSGAYLLSGQVSFDGFSLATGTTQVQIDTSVTGAPPQITTQPSNQVALVGGPAQFTVVASGSAPLNYQWYFNTNTPLFLLSSVPTLSLSNLTLHSAGYYSVLVTNAFGTATSSFASLTLVDPLITNIVRNADHSVTLSFVGLSNATTRVWASTNLGLPAAWLPIYTNTTTSPSGTWQFIDLNASNYPVRFYRFSTP